MLQVAVVSMEGFVADEWAEWTLYTQSAIESFHPICDDVIPSHPLPELLSVSDWILWRGLRRTVIFPGYHFNHHRQRDPDYNRPTTQRPSNHHHARQQEPLARSSSSSSMQRLVFYWIRFVVENKILYSGIIIIKLDLFE